MLTLRVLHAPRQEEQEEPQIVSLSLSLSFPFLFLCLVHTILGSRRSVDAMMTIASRPHADLIDPVDLGT